MPYDWLFEVERIIINLVPAYTLETLDSCDIDRLLPYYFFDYRKALRARKEAESKETDADTVNDNNVVIRNGKKYRRVTADKASWIDKAF